MEENMTSRTLTTTAKELMAAKEQKETLNAKLSEVNERLGRLEADLFRLMVDNELEKLVVDGTSFAPKIKPMASLITEFKGRFFGSLRRRKMGGLVQPEIHPSRLNAFIGEMYDKNAGMLPGWITKNVKVYEKPTISTRKSN